jgi:hypothetical protein
MTGYNIPFLISGVVSNAETDVCVLGKNDGSLLFLQENKTLCSRKDPEPQVIAEAIAAFQENNRLRFRMGSSAINNMIIPCVSMVGTHPTFYLVTVTEELSKCVKEAIYPPETTTVFRHIPDIYIEGMRPIHDRRKIIKCYTAFKRFVDELQASLE